ncbi:hypothetical protein AB833_21645 [Chromatiales bacterium (ex Bugula neritina AB1)]|nr:hypothetical protein AB833_21645 [Chromatiales bacterium (ex Bugula neritina AB1)]
MTPSLPLAVFPSSRQKLQKSGQKKSTGTVKRYHPQIHVVLPGGVITDGKLWKAPASRYLFNEFSLAKVFRARFLDAINKAGLVLPTGVPQQWVAHCKHAGRGESALRYLARYLYRGVISESSITSNQDGKKKSSHSTASVDMP